VTIQPAQIILKSAQVDGYAPHPALLPRKRWRGAASLRSLDLPAEVLSAADCPDYVEAESPGTWKADDFSRNQVRQWLTSRHIQQRLLREWVLGFGSGPAEAVDDA